MEIFFIFGGIILLYVGLVVVCAFVALAWARRRKIGVWGQAGAFFAVLFLAYAITFGDQIIGIIKFKRLCDEHAGVKIYQTVENVEGIVWGTGRLVQPYTTHGYSFYEVISQKEEIYRYVLGKNEEVKEEKADTPIAKYLVRRNKDVQIGKYYKKSDFVILERNTEKTIASYTTVHYAGGWLNRELRGVGIGGSLCPAEPRKFLDFIHSVLKPRLNRE
jgi:hypothetical protein